MPSVTTTSSSSCSRSNTSSALASTSGHAAQALPGSAHYQHGYITDLPDHVIDIIVSKLAGGSRSNFRCSCKALRAAVNRHVSTLDLYEHCGWGDGSHNVPPLAFKAKVMYPNVRSIIFPSGWRHMNISKLLQHESSSGCVSSSNTSNSSSNTSSSSGSSSSSSSSTWRQLSAITLHFHALSPSTGAALAALAPNVTHITLSLDLAYEQVSRQAWRIAALQQLQQLKSLTVEPDLRPEALTVLSRLSGLRQLQLVGSSHCSHPVQSLEALAGLSQLTSLHVWWRAGRTLAGAQLLAGLTQLQELQLWLSGGSDLPPCSSKPLPGMLEAVGQLTSLTQLQLLQGLYMSWDLRQIRHLSSLQQLQVVGLHDSVLCEDELALLVPCRSLRDLRVDTLRLPAVRSRTSLPGAAAAAAAVAGTLLAGADAAAGAVAAAGAGGDSAAVQPLDLALITLARLQHLEVNMLHLGLWQLDEVCPHLVYLTPLEATLGAKGHGVVWDLGAIEGHPQLRTLGLMVGALGTTCSCHKSFKTSSCAESLAAAVVRVILQSAGISRTGGAPSGSTVQQLLGVLRSLPQLQQVQLWGHAGGVSGRTLATVTLPQSSSSSSSCSSSPVRATQRIASFISGSSSMPVSPSGSDVLSAGSGVARAASIGGSSNAERQSTGGGMAAAVGDLFSSFGALLTPRSISHGGDAAAAGSARVAPAAEAEMGQDIGVQECGFGWMDAGATGPAVQPDGKVGQQGVTVCGCGTAGEGCRQQPHTLNRAGSSTSDIERAQCIGGANSCCCSCSSADLAFITQLLQGLPQLQLLQLTNCSYLPQAGWVVAAQCCSKGGGPAVAMGRADR